MNTYKSAKLLQNSRLQKFATLQHSSRGMPVLEAGITYKNGGKPNIVALHARGKNLVIARTIISQEYSAYTVPNPAWLVFHIPLKWSGSYFFNGRELTVGDAVVSDCPNGYFGRGRDRDALTIGVPKNVIFDTMRSLTGHMEDDLAIEELNLRPTAYLLRLVLNAVNSDSKMPQLEIAHFKGQYITDLTSQEIIDQIASELLPTCTKWSRSTGRIRRSSDVVGEALSYAMQINGAKVPSLSELCKVTGVGQTRLFECFMEQQGLPPHACLQKIRLDAALFRLSDVHNLPHSVKQVALELGFSKSGRFAEQFQRQFGELPSSLLSRTKKEIGL
ncbi:hypothetical protein NBRC116589_11790 [Ruegeria sp. HU-ET01832]|uniref:helix-turn-helix domain-containing protein n=1 Tax=Ruegeria sp. HU-ET01832 TaxID=3135906 RepID=UPI003107D8BC